MVGSIVMVIIILGLMGVTLFFIGKSVGGSVGAAGLFIIWLVVCLNDILRRGKPLPMPERMKQAIQPHIEEGDKDDGV